MSYNLDIILGVLGRAKVPGEVVGLVSGGFQVSTPTGLVTAQGQGLSRGDRVVVQDNNAIITRATSDCPIIHI